MSAQTRTWFITVCLAGASGPQEAPPDAPASTRPIRAVLDLQVAAWNRGDLDTFMTTYWNSPNLVFQSGGTRTRGWQATLDRYRKRYQAEGKSMGRLTFTDVEIEQLSPDVALARGRWKLQMPDGSSPAGLYTLILKKLPEGWKIVHDHTSLGD